MNKAIKAVLTKDISFIDFNGHTRTLPEGQFIDVIQVRTRMISLNMNGQRSVELMGDFVGAVGNESFDIKPSEFKTFD